MTRWPALAAVQAAERRRKALERLAPREAPSLPRGLMQLVPALSPTYGEPRHLAPLIDLLEEAPGGNLGVAVSVAPRMGKTDTICAAVAHWLRKDPTLTVIYVAHSASLALSKSTRARELALAAGVRIDPSSRGKAEWLTTAGGGLRAFGIEAGILGVGCHVAIVDDPLSGIAAASSSRIRDAAFETIRTSIATRIEPGGSMFVVAQRLHPLDPPGRAIDELGFTEINIPARDDQGHSIWPERFSDEWLREQEIRVGPLPWQSMYMGRPVATSGGLFGDAVLIEDHEIPVDGPVVLGCDLAFTANDRSDEQAVCVMRRSGDKFVILDARSKVAHLTSEIRGTRRERGFAAELAEMQRTYRASEIVQFVGANEHATLALLARLDGEDRVRIRAMKATSEKLLRAQPLIGAWRAGRVLIPRKAPWADALITALTNTTFAKNGRDDLADAVVAAHAALSKSGTGPKPRGTGEGSRAHSIRRYL